MCIRDRYMGVLVASDAFVEHGDEGVQVLAGLLVECIQPPDQSVEKVQGKVFRGLGVAQKQFQVVGVAEFAGIAHEGSQADASGQGQGGLGTVAGEEAAQRSPSGYGITGTQMDELFGSRAELLDEEKNFLFVCPGNGKGPGQNGIQGDLAGPDHGKLAGAEGGPAHRLYSQQKLAAFGRAYWLDPADHGVKASVAVHSLLVQVFLPLAVSGLGAFCPGHFLRAVQSPSTESITYKYESSQATNSCPGWRQGSVSGGSGRRCRRHLRRTQAFFRPHAGRQLRAQGNGRAAGAGRTP
eukprot:TRINITY_DN48104_c0_g1_i1.p1 TRINITY_DN48104_c0_g1~~TRINITY_DN48104_c0_g1_i1.p1  ORF type:complete len:296 (-),score=78.71 TRINITY_DN48104_c0_g1_i1:14-901(-)